MRLLKKYWRNNKNENELLYQSSMVTNVNTGSVSSPIDSDFEKWVTKSRECNKYMLNIGNNMSDFEEWNYVLTRLGLNSSKSPHLTKKQSEFIEHQNEMFISGMLGSNANANALYSNIISKSGKDSIKAEYGNVGWMVDKGTNVEYGIKVAKIERIQNSRLLLHYWKYYNQSLLNVSMNDNINANHDSGKIEECYLWHGSRINKPKLIWNSKHGFDTRKSNIGDCIWLARDSSYVMSGYEYKSSKNDGNFKIVLSLCCTSGVGDKDVPDTTSYDDGTVYGVRSNHAVYPAYVVTYSKWPLNAF